MHSCYVYFSFSFQFPRATRVCSWILNFFNREKYFQSFFELSRLVSTKISNFDYNLLKDPKLRNSGGVVLQTPEGFLNN